MNMKQKKDMYSPPDDALWLVPLGGCGEIGMNLNLYGTKGKWLMADCGIMFPDETTPGIEVITPDITFISERKDDLLGIVITHAHEDHLGAIERLWNDLRCPVYAVPFAAEVLRAKFRQAGLLDVIPIKEIPCGGSFEVGPFGVEMVNVTHSVPESAIIAIKTEHGTVIHTGDWKFDPEPVVGKLTDEARLRELGDEGVLAVVGDSTGAMHDHQTVSELTIQESFIKLFGDFEQRIIVACFASNIARLKSIAIAARENGRSVALVGRSLWRNAEIAERLGYLPEYNDFLSEHEAMQSPRDKVVMICTGCQGENRAALARIAHYDHPVVRFDKGDAVLYSAREIPGNEKAISRIQNLLLHQGLQIVTSDHALIHTSGHGGRPEIKKMYELVRPKVSIAVHGELRHQVEHERLAKSMGIENTFIPENGQVIRLGPGISELVGNVQAGRWGLDGRHLRAMDLNVVRDRRKMNFSGVAVVTIVINQQGLVAADPQVTLLGIDDNKALVKLRNALSDTILDEVERMPRSVLLDDKAFKENIRRKARRYFRETHGKKPIIEVHLVRVIGQR